MPWRKVNGQWEWYSVKEQQKQIRDDSSQQARSQAAMRNDAALKQVQIDTGSHQIPSSAPVQQPTQTVQPTFESKLFDTFTKPVDTSTLPKGVNPTFAQNHPIFTNVMNFLTSPIRSFQNDTTAGKTLTRFGQQAGDVATFGASGIGQQKVDTGNNTLNQFADFLGNIGGVVANPGGMTNIQTIAGKVGEKAAQSKVPGMLMGGVSKVGDAAGNLINKIPNQSAQRAFQALGEYGGKAATANVVSGAIVPNQEGDSKNFFEKAGSSLRSGTGDVVENTGQTAKWLGMDKAGSALENFGQSIQKGYEQTPTQFGWKALLDPNFYATNVSRSVPFMLSMLPMGVAGMYGGVKAANGLADLAKVGPFGRKVMQHLGSFVGGGATAGAMEAAMEAGQVHDEALQRGMNEDQANKAANETFWKNAALLGISNGTELLAAFSPIKGLDKLGKVASGAIRAGTSALTEGAEEGIQDTIQKHALGDPQNFGKDFWEQVAVGGLLGGGMGAAGGAEHGGNEKPNPIVDVQQKVYNKMDDNMREAFDQTVQDHITNGLSPEEAQVATFDEVAQTPEGDQLITEAMNEVHNNLKNEEISTANAKDVQVEDPQLVQQVNQQGTEPLAQQTESPTPDVLQQEDTNTPSNQSEGAQQAGEKAGEVKNSGQQVNQQETLEKTTQGGLQQEGTNAPTVQENVQEQVQNPSSEVLLPKGDKNTSVVQKEVEKQSTVNPEDLTHLSTHELKSRILDLAFAKDREQAQRDLEVYRAEVERRKKPNEVQPQGSQAENISQEKQQKLPKKQSVGDQVKTGDSVTTTLSKFPGTYEIVDANEKGQLMIKDEQGKIHVIGRKLVKGVINDQQKDQEKLQQQELDPSEAVTGKPIQGKVYQGRGKTTEEIYGPDAVKEGRAVPILGPGQYYTFNPNDAKFYGDVSEKQTSLNNPLVIDSDTQWVQLMKDAGAQHLDSQGPLFYNEPDKIPEATRKIQEYAKKQGHDGVIVTFDPETDKRMRESFGHSQMVVFDKSQENKKTPEKEAQIEEEKPKENTKTKYDAAREKLEWSSKMADLARKRINSRKNNLNSLPMNDLIDYAIVGMDKLLHGVVDFAEWSEDMVKEFGGNEKLHRYLKAIYAQSEEMVDHVNNGREDEVFAMIEDTQGADIAEAVRREMETPAPEDNLQDEIARVQKLVDEKKVPLVKHLQNEYKNGNVDAIRKQVMKRGGIKSNDLKEEYKNIPLAFKNRNGLPFDEMADELGLTERQLIDALTGKQTAINYDDMAERMLKHDEEYQALKETLRSLKGEEKPQEEPQQKQEEQKPASTSQPAEYEFTIKQSKHTKTGETIWVVNFKDEKRLSNEEYQQVLSRMKKIESGVKWNRVKPNVGFIFKKGDPSAAIAKEFDSSQPETGNNVSNSEVSGENDSAKTTPIEYKAGDTVTWKSSGKTISGIVKEIDDGVLVVDVNGETRNVIAENPTLQKMEKGEANKDVNVSWETSPATLEEVPSENVSGTGKVGSIDENIGDTPGTSGNGTGTDQGGATPKGSNHTQDELPGESSTSKHDSSNGVGTSEGSNSTSKRGGSTNTRNTGEGATRGTRSDFVITNELDDLGSAKTKFKQNVSALRLLHDLDTKGLLATPEEQSILAKYVGWGGLSNAFKQEDKNWNDEIAELKSLIKEGVITQEEYEMMRRTTQYAHYTSKEVIGSMYQALEQFGFKGGRVLEPSVGIGNFFGLMPGEMSKKSSRVGVEMDSISGRIAKQLYQMANIQIKPFQDYKIADGYFDAAVGNPPFSSVTLKYGEDKVQLHNYFFLQSLDKVRDGGILAFVTSSGTMNARTNDQVRQMMANKADFLGAIRLPGDAFKKNAGTEVTTDIIFFQKRPAGEGPSMQKPNHVGAFVKTYKLKVKDKEGNEVEVDNNVYFGQHPEMVLGEYTLDKLVQGHRLGVKSDGRNLAEALVEAISKLPKNIYQEMNRTQEMEHQEVNLHDFNIKSLEEGNYGLHQGNIVQRVGDTVITVSLTGKKRERVAGMIPIRDAASKVLDLQRQGASDGEVKKAQSHLNKLYDAYIKKHGYLNESANKTAFKDDVLGSSILLSLENYEEKGTGKNKQIKSTKDDIFTQRTIQTTSRATKADTAEEALAISLFEKGKVDLDHMSELSGKKKEELTKELLGKIYENPKGGWETDDEYLSGNVRVKLQEAKEAATKDNRFNINVEALEAIQPEDLTADQISVRLGSPWIPTDVIEDFVKNFFGISNHVQVSHIPLLGQWNVDKHAIPSNNTVNKEEYGVFNPDTGVGCRAVDLINDALNMKNPRLGWYDEDKKFHLDQEATNDAISKYNQIQEAFRDWIWEDENRMVLLTRKYNDEFNATRQREYNGEAIYGEGDKHNPIPGLNKKFKLRKHQKNAVWRVVRGGNTLLAHVVGAGKTLEMITSGMEMRRLGLINKPMYVVPNHLLDQWETEFRDAYPAAKILKISSESIPTVGVKRGEIREEVKRSETIASGMKVNIKGDTKKYTVQGISGDEIYVKGTKGKSFSVKRPEVTHKFRPMTDMEFNERRKIRQAERGAALNKIAVGNYDAVLITHKTFEKLPVSPELVQDFIRKQLDDLETALTAAKDNAEDVKRDYTVKQLENAKESLEQKLKSNIDEESKDIAVPFEMLGVDQIFVDEAHMFKNLQFHTSLKVKGLSQRSAKRAEDMFLKTQWLSETRGGKGVVFATGTPISNSMAEMYTMQRYLGMPDLRAHEIGHFDSWAAGFGNTVSSVEMDATGGFKQVERFAEFNNLPELMSMFRDFSDIQTADMLDLPRPKNVKYETVVAPMSEGQKAFLDTLKQRANALKNGAVTPKEDNWLKLTGDGRKAALDLRLVMDEVLKYIPYNQQAEVRRSILEDNPESKVNKAVENAYQIWKDTTTGMTDKFGEPIDKLAQLMFLDLGTPKAKQEVESSDDEENSSEQEQDNSEEEFASVYEEIRNKLIEKGIPREDIAFIHEAKTDKQKEILFQNVKRGDVRILIGSTEKMGAGMNVQDKLIALHHLDAPWRPSDIEQREGRIIRQGNRNDTVHIFNYTTEGSFDALMWGILKKKATFIAQVMNGKSDARTIEDVGEFVAGFAHVEAITTGDTTVIDKYDADMKANELQSLKKSYDKTKNKRRSDITKIPGLIQSAKEELAGYEKDLKSRKDTSGDKFYVRIGKNEWTNRKEAGDALNKVYLEKYDKLAYGEKEKIGSFAGFDLYLHKKIGYAFTLQGENSYSFAVNTDNPSGTVQRMENAVRDIEGDIEHNQTYIKQEEKRLDELKELVKQPFAKEKELKEALERQAELTKKLLEKNQDSAVQGDDENDGEIRNLATSAVDGGTDKKLTPKAAKKVGDLIANAFGTVVRQAKPKSRKARGDFDPHAGVGRVKPKEGFNWRVFGHELAHRMYQNGYKGIPDEMEAVAEHLYPGNIPTRKMKREEGLAEFFQLWVVDPEKAMELAPQTAEDIEKFIMNDPKLSKTFTKVFDIVRKDVEGKSIERVLGSISFQGEEPIDKTIGDEYQVSKWERPVFEILNYAIPFRDLMGEVVKKEKKRDPKTGKIINERYSGLDLYHYASTTGGARERARENFLERPRDQYGRYLTKRSLKSIADDSLALIEKTLGKNNKLIKEYGAYRIFSGILQSKLYEIRNEKGGFEINPINIQDAKNTLQWAEDTFGEDILNLVDEYGKTLSHIVMEKLTKAGVVTPELRKRIEDKYDGWYLPTYDATQQDRIGGVMEGGRTSKNPVKRYKEQSGPVKDFLTATMLKLAEVEQAVEYKRLLDGLEEVMNMDGMGHFLQEEKRPTVVYSLSGEEIIEQVMNWMDHETSEEEIGDSMGEFFIPNTVKFFKGGGLKEVSKQEPVIMNRHGEKLVFMRLSPDLFKSLMAMKPVNQTGWIKWMAKTSSWLRYWKVTSTQFVLNQLFRDTVSAGIQKADPRSVILGAIRGATLTMRKSEDAKKIYDAYVTSGAFVSNAESVLQMHKRATITDGLIETSAPGWKRTTKGIFHWVFDKPGHILHMQEQIQRLAEFESRVKTLAEQHGIDPKKVFDGDQALNEEEMKTVEKILVEAGYAGSEVTANFSLHGASDAVRQSIGTISFLHGASQGMYKEVRTLSNPATRKQAWWRMLGYTIPFTLLCWAATRFLDYGEDDDTPSSTKDMYWLLPIGGRFRIAFAKPHMYAMVANMIERFADWTFAERPDLARSWNEDIGNIFGNALIPPYSNDLFAIPIQLMYNQDHWGNKIVPQSQEGLSKDLQVGPNTSEIAKLAGNLGLSPRQVDYVLKNLFGASGKLALQITDAVSGKGWPAGAEDQPLLGSVIRADTEGGSRIVDRFYKDLDRSSTLNSSVLKWAEQYNKTKKKPPMRFTEQDVKLTFAKPALSAVSGIMSDLRKELNTITSDKTISGTQKHQLNLKMMYYEKVAAGFLYGYTPKLPNGISQEEVEKFQGQIKQKVDKAIIAERSRKGGATENGRTIQQFMNLK